MHAALLTFVLAAGAAGQAGFSGEYCDGQNVQGYGGSYGGLCQGQPQLCYGPRFGCYSGDSRYIHRYPAFHGWQHREPYNYRQVFEYPWHAEMNEPTSLFAQHVEGQTVRGGSSGVPHNAVGSLGTRNWRGAQVARATRGATTKTRLTSAKAARLAQRVAETEEESAGSRPVVFQLDGLDSEDIRELLKETRSRRKQSRYDELSMSEEEIAEDVAEDESDEVATVAAEVDIEEESAEEAIEEDVAEAKPVAVKKESQPAAKKSEPAKAPVKLNDAAQVSVEEVEQLADELRKASPEEIKTLRTAARPVATDKAHPWRNKSGR